MRCINHRRGRLFRIAPLRAASWTRATRSSGWTISSPEARKTWPTWPEIQISFSSVMMSPTLSFVPGKWMRCCTFASPPAPTRLAIRISKPAHPNHESRRVRDPQHPRRSPGHNARYFLLLPVKSMGIRSNIRRRKRYWGHVDPIGVRSVYDEAKRFAEALNNGLPSLSWDQYSASSAFLIPMVRACAWMTGACVPISFSRHCVTSNR